MRRLVIVLGFICVVSASASAAEAQESSPAPDESARVELPEHGFAARLPDGWLALCPPSEETMKVLAGFGDTGRALDDQEQVALDAMTAMFSECQFIAARLADEGQQVTATCKADAGPLVAGTFDYNVAALSETLSAGEDTVSSTTSTVDLTAGRAAVIDVEYQTRSPRHWANFLVEGDRAILVITCAGHVRPDDDWLSIAESFEFLPAEE